VDTFAFVFVVLICWSVIGLNNVFPKINRPEIFRYERGELYLFALMLITTISIGSAVIWMLLTIWWLKAIAIGFLGLLTGAWLYKKLPMILSGSAIGVLLWAVGLIAANFTAWGVLRP
jgi:hypothetical protein